MRRSSVATGSWPAHRWPLAEVDGRSVIIRGRTVVGDPTVWLRSCPDGHSATIRQGYRPRAARSGSKREERVGWSRLGATYDPGLCLAPPRPRSLPPTTRGCAWRHLAQLGCHAQLVVVSDRTEPGGPRVRPRGHRPRPYATSGSCSDAIVSRSTRADARRPSNSATERSIRRTRSTPSRWTTVGNDRYTSSMPL
jgi:hypothetical protein